MLNRIYSGSGLVVFLIGLVCMFKAAGMADLGGDLESIVRYSIGGAIICALGSFVHWWRV